MSTSIEEGEMVQLEEGSTSTGSAFTRLLVVVDGSDESRQALEFADAWRRAVGAEVQLLELPADGSVGRTRSAVSAVVDAAGAFGADVIVVGCQKRRLANHRLGLGLRERLARATDVPLLVPSPARDRRGHDGDEGFGRASLGGTGSRTVTHV